MSSLFDDLRHSRRSAILDEWLSALRAGAPQHTDAPASMLARSDTEAQALYDAILDALIEHQPADSRSTAAKDTPVNLTALLRQWSAEPARQGLSPAQPISGLLALKRILLRELIASPDSSRDTELPWLEQLFDSLALLTFETFGETRERMIAAQSLSLMELSTPVLRLWHRILLLPLVGVIDTQRARQITERLLEAIVQHEARVSILDLTGVPIIDTSVAQHLMKTIDATRLLGTRTVMTGISPEGAQTLTKLGIRFGDVISRATLRAGIAEALLMVDRRIAPVEARRATGGA
ncbi:MAG: anti-anti-sigma factor [Halochromatium sp.]|nr:anti-anti-sigma factor [Halochromatium sp.]